MATVNLNINSKNYSINCGTELEGHVLDIASKIDEKVRQLVQTFGNLDNEMLLLMVCIFTFNDLKKLQIKNLDLEKKLSEFKTSGGISNFDEEIIKDVILDAVKKISNLSKNILTK